MFDLDYLKRTETNGEPLSGDWVAECERVCGRMGEK